VSIRFVEYTFSDSIQCVSIRFVSMRFVSIRFVSIHFVSIRFVSIRFVNAPPVLSYGLGIQKNTVPYVLVFKRLFRGAWKN
jgi:hypothetical protein